MPEHGRAMCEQHARDPYNSPLRPACDPALALRSPVLAVRRDFRHFVTAITGGGWVLCEVKALSHGTKGQSNGYHRFGYYRRDRIRRLVGLYGCAVEGWEGGCACGVGSDLTACDYVAVASRRNTGRILTERYRGFRATCNSPSPPTHRRAGGVMAALLCSWTTPGACWPSWRLPCCTAYAESWRGPPK